MWTFKPSIAFSTLVISLVIGTIQTQTVRVFPNVRVLYVIESNILNMTCEYTGSNTEVKWEKDGQKANYSVRTTGTVDNNQQSVSRVTLIKENATTSDAGHFACKAGNNERTIEVRVFKVTPKHATYVKGMESASLQCMPEMPEKFTDFKPHWMKGEKYLEDIKDFSDKYTIHADNYSLEIKKPERADAGKYFCEFQFDASNHKNDESVAVNFLAAPFVKKFDKSKNLIQGEKLILRCDVIGYPIPEVNWKKNDELLKETDKIKLEDHDDIVNGMLTIESVDFDDKGSYICFVDSLFFNMSANGTIVVRVKDKLAALWPFLGIVAEVVVLCIIIFIYEKKRSKNEDDGDDTCATNTTNAADHKGKEEVRQRNVKA